jgi:uncharacterized protein (DUF1786 family)
MRLLALDIGAGTTDILVYDRSIPVENSLRLVLPSATVAVARRITRATAAGRPIHLTGPVMGGGACVRAIEAHLQAGLTVCASEPAALTVTDNIDDVRSMGIEVTDTMPANAVPISTGDIPIEMIKNTFARFEIPMPDRFAVAVQDHGFAPNGSNRKFRFEYWHDFVASGGAFERLVHETIPPSFTRLTAAQAALPEGRSIAMDTSAAAILGILDDHSAAATHTKSGLIAINVGNAHTLGAAVVNSRVTALFEHHTGLMNAESVGSLVEQLAAGTLKNSEVFDAGGHGACVAAGFDGIPSPGVAVTGPQRARIRSLGYHEAAPHGDAMLTGCYGLLRAARLVWGE